MAWPRVQGALNWQALNWQTLPLGTVQLLAQSYQPLGGQSDVLL
jgi:hypothetical protein